MVRLTSLWIVGSGQAFPQISPIHCTQPEVDHALATFPVLAMGLIADLWMNIC
jgi:hypothetical protein